MSVLVVAQRLAAQQHERQDQKRTVYAKSEGRGRGDVHLLMGAMPAIRTKLEAIKILADVYGPTMPDPDIKQLLAIKSAIHKACDFRDHA